MKTKNKRKGKRLLKYDGTVSEKQKDAIEELARIASAIYLLGPEAKMTKRQREFACKRLEAIVNVLE